MRKLFTEFTLLATMLAMTNVVIAECNGKGGGATPLVALEQRVPAAVNTGTNDDWKEAIHAPHPHQADGRRYPLQFVTAGSAAWERSLVPLVPATVGQTYARMSRPIPVDKHPRTAMLVVRDHGRVAAMTVSGMSGFRMSDGDWLFESIRPLRNCTENVVRVEADGAPNDMQPWNVKFARLIPGRQVYLDVG